MKPFLSLGMLSGFGLIVYGLGQMWQPLYFISSGLFVLFIVYGTHNAITRK